jgi:hypothetical protein
MITSFTIAGVEVEPLFETFDVRETVGGVSTLSCDVISVGSPVQRFGVFDVVTIVEDGVTIFAGNVTQTREKGFGGPNIYDSGGAPQIVTTITAEDYNRIGERVTVTETVAAGTTLTAFLTTLVSGYLTGLGVTLDPSQVTGPALPAMSFDLARASEVLSALSDATGGYLWRIDYDKKLRMWLPGDLSAPFDIDEFDSPAKWTGDVEVETILGDNYANRVTVICAPVTEEAHYEDFTGDGTTDTWDVEWTVLQHRGYVTDDLAAAPDINKTLTTTPYAGSASWTFHPESQTLVREIGPLPLGQIARFTFKGTFAATATAEDAGEIAAHGLYEHVERRSDITTAAAAQALADEILAALLVAGEQTLTYETRMTAPNLRAGQSQGIEATARDVSGDYIIRDLRIRAEVPATSDGWLVRSVTAKQTQPLVGKWQSTYHDWLKVGGAGATTSVGGGAVSGGGPSPPFTSVQFNRDGSFGGDDDFTYDVDSATVMVGTGHTPAGGDNLLVGDGHTVL